MKKVIKKRTFSGKDNGNIFHSVYMTSYKYAAARLVEPTKTHMGGIGYFACKTKAEAENRAIDYPNIPYEDFEQAKKDFNTLINLK